MTGLRPDFSDDAVWARLFDDGISGLPKGVQSPHDRAGHAAPSAPTERELGARSGIEALRHPEGDDGIPKT